MKGKNELRLNQATMVEALQSWVDKNFMFPPKVLGVTEDISTWVIDIEGEKSDADGAK